MYSVQNSKLVSNGINKEYRRYLVREEVANSAQFLGYSGAPNNCVRDGFISLHKPRVHQLPHVQIHSHTINTQHPMFDILAEKCLLAKNCY